jgi:hypothetical protein
MRGQAADTTDMPEPRWALMSRRFTYDEARAVLNAACDVAGSGAHVSPEWLRLSEVVASLHAITYTPLLGTALLAKATDETTDALSIKADSGEDAYSARTLCHEILVPVSVERHFHLRTTGREPLNNQPFFRYDRVDAIERVKYPEELKILVDVLKRINSLSRIEAGDALAAFLRTRLDAARARGTPTLRLDSAEVPNLFSLCRRFLAEDAEGGKRGQALVAAILDMNHADVRTSRVNDPSRHFPGDVHVFHEGRVVLAAEVRAKPVKQTEVSQFAAAVATAGIPQGLVVALADGQEALDATRIWTEAWDTHGLVLSFVDGIEELLLQGIYWSGLPVSTWFLAFSAAAMSRLAEMEVSSQTLSQWAQVCGSA